MKYIVLKDFLDRFDNKRHCKPGEDHHPPTEERAQQLVELGFIAPVSEPQESNPVPEPEKPKGRGRKKDVGGADGSATEGE